MMNYLFFYLFFLFSFVQATSQYLLNIPESEFKLMRQFESSHSYIGVVIHKKTGTLYIVKQKKNKRSIRWSMIQAILAYEYAVSTEQIISQRVYVIPKNINFPGKKYQDEPASLHTIVPGMSVKNWQYSIRGIDLNKVSKLVEDFSVKLPRDGGIDLKIIESMTRHGDLPPIVALHLLVGFYDCHNKNIFYDYHKNRFSIIDMDSCYKSFLTSFSYESLKTILMKRKFSLPPKVQSALLCLADALELMIERNTTEKMNSILMELFDLLKLNDRWDQRKFLIRINKVKPFLEKSYEDGKKIVTLIRNTFRRQRRISDDIMVIPPRYCIVDTVRTPLPSIIDHHDKG